MGALTTYRELRTRYNTGWVPPVTEFPNEAFTEPVPAAMWARFTTSEGDELQLDIGTRNPAFRNIGVLIIQLFSPLTTGAIDILEKADTLAAVFRNWCGATVTCREATIRNIGNDGYGWYQVNVIIPYKTDELH